MKIIGIDNVKDNQIDYKIDNQLETNIYNNKQVDNLFPTFVYGVTGDIINSIFGDIPDDWLNGQNLQGSVVVGNSAKIIGADAFRYNDFTGITIPNSVTEIKQSAFAFLPITSIELPSSINYIPNYLFYASSLTGITISNNITGIGLASFIDNSLTYVFIPNSVSGIGTDVFRNNDLTGIRLSPLLREIPETAFLQNQIRELQIPSTIENIGSRAFMLNQISGDLIMPNNITGIGNQAFSSNLIKYVRLPDNLRRISNDAFQQNSITGIGLIPTGIQEFIGFRSNQISNITIPNTITFIGTSALRSNLLTGINIPNSVTGIGSNAFSSNQITNLTIPDSVIEVRTDAFGNNQITGLTLSNNLKSIGTFAFRSNRLTELSIPSGVETVGLYAFTMNSGLKTVYSNIPLTAYLTDVFSFTTGKLTIFARFDDNTWTSGTGLSLLGNNTVTVIKSLNELGADAITVSGAGTSGINGIYTLRGTNGDKPFYNKVNTNTDVTTNSIYWDNNQWGLNDGPGDIYYKSTDNTSFPWQSPSWIPDSGSLPVPSFTKRSLPSIVIAETDIIEITNFPLGNGVYTKGFEEGIGYYYIRDDGNYYLWVNYVLQKWAFASLTNDLILCDANEDPNIFIPNSEWRFTLDSSIAPLKLLGVG
jgi:hypothetical protein